MRGGAQLLLLGLAGCLAAGPASAQEPPWWGPQDLSAVVDSLQLAPGQVRVQLPVGFVAAVDGVRLDSANLVEDEEYRVALDAGYLVLARPALGDEWLVVQYRIQPASIRSQILLHDPTPAAPGSAPDPRDPAAPSRAAPAQLGALTISGSKSVSVQGGSNRDATVDQALRLSVGGELAAGIQVRAEISDENLPITPEGNTEELADLDQVRIELFGPRGRAVLGDFTAVSDWGTFVPYQRKLQGLELVGRQGDASAMVLAGAPRGRRLEVELRGREGVQGPYELLDGLRLDQSFIVAGTERVWVDGERMQRGQDRDYVVDYVRGTLRFTETRPIGPDSRIAVDFETSDTAYTRAVAGVRADSLRAGPVRLRLGFLQEADDADRPTGGALSAADRDSLSRIGDDAARAFGSGVTPRPGEGRYLERFDQGTRYFEFADSTDGDFDVAFLRVGAEQGSYVLDGVDDEGRPVFRYVGNGEGDHVVGRRLGLPSTARVAVLGATLGGLAGPHLRLELDASEVDANVLSSRDDGDNQGVAYRVDGASGWWGGEQSGLRVTGLAELLGEDFRSLARIRAPFFYEAWNLQDEARDRAEERQEVAAHWRSRGRRAEVGLERLARRDLFDGRRLRSTGEGRVLGPVSWKHRLAFLEAERDAGRSSQRRDRSVGLFRAEGRWRPRATAFDERFTEDRATGTRGFRNAGWRAGVGLGGPGRSLDVGFERGVADSLRNAGTWAFARDVRQWTGIGRLAAGSSTFDADVHWRTASLPAGREETTRLARIRAAHRPAQAVWSGDLEYRAGTDASRVLQREVVFVGLGEGDHDAEGNLVGVRQGDYEVVYTPSDSLVQSTEVELRVSLDVTPRTSFARGIASKTLLQIRERNRGEDVGAILRLDPGSRLDNELTVFGEERIRQELLLLRDVRRLDLRLTHDTRRTLDQRFAGGAERGRRRTRTARLEAQLSRGWVARVELGDEDRDRSAPSTANPLLASYGVVDRFVAGTARAQPTARTRLSWETRYTDRREETQGLEQDILEAKPSVTTELGGGRWTLDLRWARVRETAGADPVRPFFFERPGDTRSAALASQWTLGANFTVLVRYQLRDEPERDLRQDLSLETRARF